MGANEQEGLLSCNGREDHGFEVIDPDDPELPQQRLCPGRRCVRRGTGCAWGLRRSHAVFSSASHGPARKLAPTISNWSDLHQPRETIDPIGHPPRMSGLGVGSSVCASMLAPHHPFQGRPRHRDPAGAEFGCRPGASGLPGSLDALTSCAVWCRKSIGARPSWAGWALRHRTLGGRAFTRSTARLVSDCFARMRNPDK